MRVRISPPQLMKIGDKVVKNQLTWTENDFDSWGRGIGVGVIVTPPFLLPDDEVDVQWEAGRCFEKVKGLKLYGEEEKEKSSQET